MTHIVLIIGSAVIFGILALGSLIVQSPSKKGPRLSDDVKIWARGGRNDGR